MKTKVESLRVCCSKKTEMDNRGTESSRVMLEDPVELSKSGDPAHKVGDKTTI